MIAALIKLMEIEFSYPSPDIGRRSICYNKHTTMQSIPKDSAAPSFNEYVSVTFKLLKIYNIAFTK